MIFRDAVHKFECANDRGEIPNLRTGELRRVSSSRLRGVITSVRSALHRATEAADVLGVELDPYAETLPDHAKLDAEERGLARPANYAANVRLFLAVVEERVYKRQRDGRNRALEPWRDLYDALERYMQRTGSRTGLRGALIRLQNLALLRGCCRPHALPARSVVEEWITEAGLSTRYRRKIFKAYREAHAELADPDLPTLNQVAPAGERGIHTLPDLGARLSASGCAEPVEDLGRETILQQLAPKIAKAARRYLDAQSEPSPAHVKQTWGASSRLVAEAARLGVSLGDLDLLKVFQPRVVVTHQHDELLADIVPGPATTTVSIMAQVLDAWARRSWRNSPLELVSRDEDDFVYTDTVRKDLERLFRIFNEVYGETLRSHRFPLWSSAEGEYRRLGKKVKHHNDKRPLINRKQKGKLLGIVTWPQLVCMGLPGLRRKVVKLREHFFRAVEDHRLGRLSDRSLDRRRSRYFRWLFRYILVAVMADDGLRVKNYAGATHGRNVAIEGATGTLEDGRQVLQRIDRVETHFRGYEDRQQVRLKRRLDGLKRDRERTRYLLPGIVDLDLFLDYWNMVRPSNLMKAGLAESDAPLDPRTDRFALFVSPHSADAHGAYSTAQLSLNFGWTLHWICRHVLGRQVPDFESEEKKTEWRELFAAHVTRLLIATYWGGIRQDWSHAQNLTDDKRKTLDDAYDRAADSIMQKKYQLHGWEHPEFFDDLLDRIRQGEVVDWEKVRRDLGLP